MAKAARRIPMTVTFLEMNAKPRNPSPPQPRGKIALLKCISPPTHFYRYLYDTVGEDYFWVDRKKMTPEKLTEIIHDPLNQLYVLYADGNPAGMAELDLRKEGEATRSLPRARGACAAASPAKSSANQRPR